MKQYCPVCQDTSEPHKKWKEYGPVIYELHCDCGAIIINDHFSAVEIKKGIINKEYHFTYYNQLIYMMMQITTNHSGIARMSLDLFEHKFPTEKVLYYGEFINVDQLKIQMVLK